ncbi:MAG: transglycosylase family protein [Ilumatobacteraceae bacterium]
MATLTVAASVVGLTLPTGTTSATDEVTPTADAEQSTAPGSTSTTTTTTTLPATTTTTTTTVPAAPTSTAASTTSVPAPATTAPTTLPPAPAPQNVIAYPSQIANILATIRYMESRGNYSIPTNKGGASGAYQFITSTWNGFGGYSHAYLAPPEVQDQRAAADVEMFLRQWNNDVSMIPVMWYYPRASRDVALMDIVPIPSAGNVLTVREYQQRWLGVWAFLAGQPIPETPTSAQAQARLGLPPEPPAAEAPAPETPAEERTASVAFPVLGPTRLAAPDCGDAQDVAQNAGSSATAAEVEAAGLCADQAPGIAFGVKMQPVLSVVDGTVTAVVDEPGDVISVTVTDDHGRSYRLAGFNDDTPGTNDGAAPDHLRLTPLARVGTAVRAGQVLGFMGDTDPLPLGIRADVPTDATVDIPTDAVAPHIRLTIRDLDGTPVDAYGPVIDALFRQVCSVGTGPWASLPNGSGHEPVTIETTDDNREIDSEWNITETGQVTASGWAAMIYPSESCGWAPPDARGPGAGGTPDVPDNWFIPIDLSTSIWVDLALQDTDDLPPMPRIMR